ncbi:RsmD family RNA methyltransferase, partial [Klebsiella pneumoniae]|uniref:RsmD family RNA methyltransferase n=1 Tax=Klebsiella pneumoniae TaxID=573 RepID=UPI003EE257F9
LVIHFAEDHGRPGGLPLGGDDAVQLLQKNLATLKADRGKVITTNTLSFLSQPGTPHQIVFVDPPFRQGLLEETLRLLETQGWLADEALVYVESEVENGLPPVPA